MARIRLAKHLCWSAVLWPVNASAHVSERAIVLLLPTDVYRIVGVGAVVATILLTLLLPRRVAKCVPPRAWRPKAPQSGIGAILGFLLFATLIAFGLWGTHNSLANLLPLTLFSLWWLAGLVMAAVIGDFWRFFNPWAAPVAWVFRNPPKPLPDWVGYWPALPSYFVFAVYYLSDIAPTDPDHLARVTLVYWAVHFLLAGRYGNLWLARGEGFGVLFSLVGRLSPIRWHAARLRLPGSGLVLSGKVPKSLGLFTLLFLATGSFDGLNETFWWMARIGINPLDFPGRSAVIWQNRIGLALVFFALIGAFTLTVWLGLALAGASDRLGEIWAKMALTLLPIATAYHFAHYLPSLMVSLQYWILALNDPLDNGAHWLGLDWQVSTGFLNYHASVRAIWLSQATAIVVGHMLSVLLAHIVALNLFKVHLRALISQVFVVLFMVFYTWLGLWLLASPTAL